MKAIIMQIIVLIPVFALWGTGHPVLLAVAVLNFIFFFLIVSIMSMIVKSDRNSMKNFLAQEVDEGRKSPEEAQRMLDEMQGYCSLKRFPLILSQVSFALGIILLVTGIVMRG